MKDKIKVSIIVPVYNGEAFISECINSILKQTYQNFELIVINDGSTDNTKNIVEKYDDSRIRLFNITNNGVSNARNFGLKKSNGDFLLFVDADDKIDCKTLEILLEKQEKFGVDIIRFNGYIQNKKGVYEIIPFSVKDGTILDTKVDCENIINIINSPFNAIRCYSPLLFLKNSDIINFDTTISYLEDKLFYLENFTSSSKKILFSNELLYYYNFNIRSKTKDVNNFCKNIEDIIKARNSIANVVNNLNYDIKIVDDSITSLIMNRMEYLASLVSYRKFKNIINKVVGNESLTSIIFRKNVSLRKVQKIYNIFLRNKMYLLFYFMCKCKLLIKE